MAKPLSPEKVERIKYLISEGCTQKYTAKLMNCAVSTVNKIIFPNKNPYLRSPSNERTDKKRCPGCGGMVKLPCLACKIESLI